MSDETRALRDLLEQAQSELKRAKEDLLSARAESVTLKERVAYLEWSLNGGQSKDLVLQLAEARAEIERLKQWVAAEPEARPERRPRVCLIAVLGVVMEERPPSTQYVGFHVDANGRARDVVRSFDLDEAKRVVEGEAELLGVPVEDLT